MRRHHDAEADERLEPDPRYAQAVETVIAEVSLVLRLTPGTAAHLVKNAELLHPWPGVLVWITPAGNWYINAPPFDVRMAR